MMKQSSHGPFLPKSRGGPHCLHSRLSPILPCLSESVLSPLHSIPLHPGPYQTIHPTHLICIAYPKPHVPSPPISPSASQNRYSRARTPRVQTTLAALHETSPHTSGPTFDHSLCRPSRCLAIPCILLSVYLLAHSLRLPHAGKVVKRHDPRDIPSLLPIRSSWLR